MFVKFSIGGISIKCENNSMWYKNIRFDALYIQKSNSVQSKRCKRSAKPSTLIFQADTHCERINRKEHTDVCFLYRIRVVYRNVCVLIICVRSVCERYFRFSAWFLFDSQTAFRVDIIRIVLSLQKYVFECDYVCSCV